MIPEGVIELQHGAASLLAVPAVHYHAAFAMLINQTCGAQGQPPDAIAVELGPLIAAAVRQWLGELGIGPSTRTRLPCMLGLVKSNHLLHPSRRQRAVELQHETGQELQDLPPELLYEELGFAPTSVLALSPTDSIIEAIRSALELDLPLYGVDLDDMADSDGRCLTDLLPDPANASRNPGEYLRAIIPMVAAVGRDEQVNSRRERVMAARLKALLQRHRRVLFTGGLAHWARISAQLADPQLRPANMGPDSGDAGALGRFQRVVLHPSMAVGFIDAFPAIAEAFERRRRHPRLDPATRARPIRPLPILRGRLRRAYRQRFLMSAGSRPDPQLQSDWSARGPFEQLLVAQSLLSLRSVPTLSVIDACARATLSEPFRASVYEAIIALPWIEPGEFPECARVRPAVPGEGAPTQIVVSESGGHQGKPQHVSYQLAPPAGTGRHELPERMRDQLAHQVFGMGYRFSWRPWESLTTALSCTAIAQVRGTRRPTNPEAFAGQLLGGIDIKATLRAHARGRDEIWVRDDRRQSGGAVPDSAEGFPVVWIFEEGTDPTWDWTTLVELFDWLEKYTLSRLAFRRRIASRGDRVVNLLAYGRHASEWHAAASGHFQSAGLIVFSPVFAACRQTVRWIEATAGQHNPIVSHGADAASIVRGIAERSGLRPELLRWQDLLVAVALPYCGRSVTVVAPAGFELADTVRHAAVRQGKVIRRVGLSTFTCEHRQRIQRLDFAPGWIDPRDGLAFYVPAAERLIGEPTHQYLDLVPRFWRQYGLGR